MMKNFKLPLLVTMFLLLNAGMSYAHALYIDTNVEGKKGKTHEVKVYYSEFKDRTIEKVADWYSDVPEFELWLVKPDGERIQLQTTAKEDHFGASFVPEQKGTYRLEIGHTAEDPGGETAYQFNAFAQVWVGRSAEALPVTADGPELVLVEAQPSSKRSATKTFKTFFKGQPQANVPVTVFLPSGETKTLKSNSEGVLIIHPAEKGTYFLEATTYHEDEPGKTEKASFKSVWRCATHKFEM